MTDHKTPLCPLLMQAHASRYAYNTQTGQVSALQSSSTESACIGSRCAWWMHAYDGNTGKQDHSVGCCAREPRKPHWPDPAKNQS